MAINQRQATILDYELVKETILNMPDKTDQFMLAVSYANGTRVSEVIPITTSDIDFTDKFVYVYTKVLKKRKQKNVLRGPPISRTKEKWLADIILSYLAPKKAEWEQARNKALSTNSPVPPPLKLIDYGVRTAQRRFDKYFRCTAHSIRHTRATHCLNIFGMSMRMVLEFFKISPRGSGEWIMRYGHLDTKEIEKHWEQSEVNV